MVVESSEAGFCDSSWKGGKIYLNVNGTLADTIPYGFKKYIYCVPSDKINVKADRFRLQSSNSNGVCIQNLSIYGQTIRVGASNDQSSFWIDENQNRCSSNYMKTSQITIQNGEVISSKCKG